MVVTLSGQPDVDGRSFRRRDDDESMRIVRDRPVDMSGCCDIDRMSGCTIRTLHKDDDEKEVDDVVVRPRALSRVGGDDDRGADRSNDIGRHDKSDILIFSVQYLTRAPFNVHVVFS